MDDLARWLGWRITPWDPEHNIADAWLLLERVRELGWWVSLDSIGNREAWTCEMGRVGAAETVWASGDTAPAAICAAVRAIIALQADG